ncbi:hypothetical protein [Aeromicrobium sp. Leaf350]|uniref:hypothetical protein n=1 Tax=Aeromicrobium sp. Leaf350 TaxID=2876565 RepID=UPI001E529567|nr:hypothetical protein [Aeromicrobium sp. Leaf350]
MKKLMTVAAVSLIVITSACGAGRPSVDDISASISDAAGDAATDEQADCLADLLHGSDISDDTLNKIVDGDIDVTGVAALPEDDAKEFESLGEDFAACLGA